MLAWREGTTSAFPVLYQRHRVRLLRFLAHEAGSQAAGEEIFQEVWMTVIAHRDRYQASAKFSTWLLEIAHRRLVDWYRRNRRHTWQVDIDAALEIADYCPLPDSQAMHRQQQRGLLDCLAQLPPEQREAFLLKEEHELSQAEIAELTGSSGETVKSRVRYAIRKLRQCLESLHAA